MPPNAKASSVARQSIFATDTFTLSSVAQLEKTVALYFADRDDLMLVALETDRFGTAIVWETSRGGDLFPHLYSTLSLDSVAWARGFSSRAPEALRALISGGR